MTCRGAVPARWPSRTPHPCIQISRKCRSDRSEIARVGLKAGVGVWGNSIPFQMLAPRFRLDRLDRLEMRGNARATLKVGSGGMNPLHAFTPHLGPIKPLGPQSRFSACDISILGFCLSLCFGPTLSIFKPLKPP